MATTPTLDPIGPLDLREQIARIDRTQADIEHMQTENRKFMAEVTKLQIEARFEPWRVAMTGVATGAAIVGATVALVNALSI